MHQEGDESKGKPVEMNSLNNVSEDGEILFQNLLMNVITDSNAINCPHP